MGGSVPNQGIFRMVHLDMGRVDLREAPKGR